MEEVAGVRVAMDEDSKPVVEYLVKWKVRPRPALCARFAELYCQRFAAAALCACKCGPSRAGWHRVRKSRPGVPSALKQQTELTITLEWASMRSSLVR